MTRVSGDGQTGLVGAALGSPLRVQVAQGSFLLAGETINWMVTSGGGTLSSGTATTSTDGTASVAWTLGNVAGPQTVTAIDAKGATGSPLVFTATATAAAAASIAVAGTSAVAGFVGSTQSNALAAIVHDALGNPVSGVNVLWSTTSGTASTTTATATTGPQGVSTVGVTFPAAASTSTIRATVAGQDFPAASFTVTSVTSAVATVDVTIGNDFFSPSSTTVVAGTLVRWTLGGTLGVSHNITSDGAPNFLGSSGNLTGDGTTYQQLFITPGTYRYECTIHSGMTGTIIVQ
jgi:adhesin/invasin